MELNPKLRVVEPSSDLKKAIKLGVIQQLYKDKELTDAQYKKLIHKNENSGEIHSI